MKCLRALLKTAKMNLYLNKAAAGFSHVALWVNVAKPAVDLTQSERREPTLGISIAVPSCSLFILTPVSHCITFSGRCLKPK